MDVDPKLKEAYEKVMGKPISPNLVNQQTSREVNHAVINENKGIKMKVILISLIILAAVVGYTIFWIYYFHVSIPFFNVNA